MKVNKLQIGRIRGKKKPTKPIITGNPFAVWLYENAPVVFDHHCTVKEIESSPFKKAYHVESKPY